MKRKTQIPNQVKRHFNKNNNNDENKIDIKNSMKSNRNHDSIFNNNHKIKRMYKH